ncbi:MAG: MTH938/NDUFAF3 family protein [Actinomycetota bacterium]
MLRIEGTKFGSVTIDGETYEDVLIVEGKVLRRDKDKIRAIYGTSHVVRKEETEELLKGNPEVVIIGTGQYGSLSVDPEVASLIREAGAELIALETPKAIQKFNEISTTKHTNALLHVTC